MSDTSASIDFIVGSRRLFSVERDLANWAFSLDEVLSFSSSDIAPPQAGRDGLRVRSAPLGAVDAILACFPHHLVGSRQDYRRHFIDMRSGPEGAGFEAYLARFSGKTRSTLRRKARKLAEQDGGYHVSEHVTPAEVEEFFRLALPLSARTYQARLLDAGLPDTPEAHQRVLELAEQGRMRCFLLCVGADPIAYLSLPVSGTTVVYEHLGHAPEWARFSPGTVLQTVALERLFAEERFTYFDFTEGEGAHKAMFGTDSTECTSFALLDPTFANRALLGARSTFDAAIAGGKSIAERSGALASLRSALRA